MSALPLQEPIFDNTLDGEKGAIDLIYLSRQTMGNSVLQREILALFLTQAQVCIKKLEEVLERSQTSVADEEVSNWRMMTHTLKGSARGVGAWETADAAAAAELRCPSKGVEEAKMALETLSLSVDETCAFIDQFCGA